MACLWNYMHEENNKKNTSLNQNGIRSWVIAEKWYNRLFNIRCLLQWSTLLNYSRVCYEREFSSCVLSARGKSRQFSPVRMQRNLFVRKHLLWRQHEMLLNSATCSWCRVTPATLYRIQLQTSQHIKVVIRDYFILPGRSWVPFQSGTRKFLWPTSATRWIKSLKNDGGACLP